MNKIKNKDTKKSPTANVINLKDTEKILKKHGIDFKEFYEDIEFKGFNLQSWYDYFNEPPLEADENEWKNRRTFAKDFPDTPLEEVQNLILEKCEYEDLFREMNDAYTCAKINNIFKGLFKEIEALNIGKDKYGDVIKKWKNNKLELTDPIGIDLSYETIRKLFEVYNYLVCNDILIEQDNNSPLSN